jgi:hypothetical protein
LRRCDVAWVVLLPVARVFAGPGPLFGGVRARGAGRRACLRLRLPPKLAQNGPRCTPNLMAPHGRAGYETSRSCPGLTRAGPRAKNTSTVQFGGSIANGIPATNRCATCSSASRSPVPGPAAWR